MYLDKSVNKAPTNTKKTILDGPVVGDEVCLDLVFGLGHLDASVLADLQQ
jgi:hypothetical protein